MFVLLPRRVLEARAMGLRQQPRLEGTARRVRRQRDDFGVLVNDAPAGGHLLANDVAEHAPLFRREMPPRAFDFLADVDRDDWQRDELRMRVLEGRAGPCAMVLEHENVAEA